MPSRKAGLEVFQARARYNQRFRCKQTKIKSLVDTPQYCPRIRQVTATRNVVRLGTNV